MKKLLATAILVVASVLGGLAVMAGVSALVFAAIEMPRGLAVALAATLYVASPGMIVWAIDTVEKDSHERG